jgi:hypothetical protein
VKSYPVTPDGRYFVVHGRLWRSSNPALAADIRQQLVEELMSARREIRMAKKNAELLVRTRARISLAKRALGERGPVWWTDGAPDYNRRMAVNTPYAAWFESFDARAATPMPIDRSTGA